MATIKIVNLNSVDSELFNNSKTYLNELKEEQLSMIKGGASLACVSASLRGTNLSFELERLFTRY